MNYNIIKNKGGVISYTFIILFLTSCISISKIIIGFKNPKVITIEELKDIRNQIFNDNISDYYFTEGIKDSIFLNKILSLSFNGSLNIYNKNGEKIFFKNSTCINDDIEIINKNNDSLMLILNEKLEDNIKSLKNLDLKEQIKISDFKEYEYYIIYYWSSFMNKNTLIQNEFNYLNLNFNSSKYKIIRINCDFLDIWNLEKDKKLKLKFKKADDGYYNVSFKSIPWN
ncbi:hypothetical protein SAMN06265371_106204 [Lutibacter agarilyticus]|uniref:Lipoprotein n=1 Tax=Lutibacter agarilyticus TaxID=1109740 RepID=A0A238XPD3_9FLAO|nr:hypothetical protein [Lutibacter agarilyticus]SNR60570.1 hypothetical protein SAMN06265371_106204 [Lutibacter agarilyticus]